MKHYDLIIIGNGMVGASLAGALAEHAWSIAIIDKQPCTSLRNDLPQLDGRKIALSYGSQQILQAFDLWPSLIDFATPIQQVHVSAKNQFGALRIKATDINAEALGYVLPAQSLTAALQARAKAFDTVDFYCPATIQSLDVDINQLALEYQQTSLTLSAKLIIGADGALSYSRQQAEIATVEQDYQATALVSSIQLEHAHQHIAFQRFSDIGTLALLPMRDKTYGVVCTTSQQQCQTLMQQTDVDLLNTLQQQFGYRLGRFQKLGARFTYPIKQIIATQQVKQHFLLLGNAAHNLSPIAAQGFNLALQDVYCLVQLLVAQPNDMTAVLTQYCEQRKAEQQRVINFTDQLMKLTKDEQPLSVLAGLALSMLDIITPLKQTLIRQTAGITAQCKTLLRAQHG